MYIVTANALHARPQRRMPPNAEMLPGMSELGTIRSGDFLPHRLWEYIARLWVSLGSYHFGFCRFMLLCWVWVYDVAHDEADSRFCIG